MQAADSKLRAVLAHEATVNDTVAAVDSTALAATEATPDKAVSAADSLAAALKGGEKKQQASSADLEQLKKEHPLLAILSVNPNGGPVVGYANYKDTSHFVFEALDVGLNHTKAVDTCTKHVV